jgi:hypothetical protein
MAIWSTIWSKSACVSIVNGISWGFVADLGRLPFDRGRRRRRLRDGAVSPLGQPPAAVVAELAEDASG